MTQTMHPSIAMALYEDRAAQLRDDAIHDRLVAAARANRAARRARHARPDSR